MDAEPFRTMTVGDRMTTEPATVGPDQSLRHAQEVMQFRGIRHPPVLDGERLVGMVTDRDIREAMPSPEIIAEIQEAQSFLAMVRVAEVMATAVISVEPQTTLAVAAQLFLTQKIGALPVLLDGRLAGILPRQTSCGLWSTPLALLPAQTRTLWPSLPASGSVPVPRAYSPKASSASRL